MIYQLKSKILIRIISVISVLGITYFAVADRFSHLKLFAQTLNLIKLNYFKPIKTETLVYGAIRGLLREIDPHSHFLLPRNLERLEEKTSGQFYGLGIEVERKEHFMTVISVIQNPSTQKNGFQIGDKILKVDDKFVKNFTVDEFHYFLKKNKKQNHKITLLRENHTKPFIIQIQPVHLKFQSVNLKELKKGIFYLRIYYFSQTTLFETNKLLKNKNIKGLLLDLRGNPGGIFEQSVKITDLFLNKGLIVRYKIKTEQKTKEFIAHYSDTLPNFPLVVLIDEYSASGSEIVAGALKDHKRAILVGRKTFGKGSIQNIFPLSNNHALKLTVGEYQTPSGKYIHKKGIKPHITIKRKKQKTNTQKLFKKSILKDPEVYQAFTVLQKTSLSL